MTDDAAKTDRPKKFDNKWDRDPEFWNVGDGIEHGDKVRHKIAGPDFGREGIVNGTENGRTRVEFCEGSPTSVDNVALIDLELVDKGRKDHLYYNVLVHGVRRELWWRQIPHAYGRWNNEKHDSHLWVRIVRKAPVVQEALTALKDKLRQALRDAEGSETEVADVTKILWDMHSEFDRLKFESRPPIEGDTESWQPWMRNEVSAWSMKIEGGNFFDHKHDCLNTRFHGELSMNGIPLGGFSGSTFENAVVNGMGRRYAIQCARETCPFDFNEPQKNVGLKIWYKGQPAVIDDHIMIDQMAMMIRYDGPPQKMPSSPAPGAPDGVATGFNIIEPADVGSDPCWFQGHGSATLKVDILGRDIKWHRK